MLEGTGGLGGALTNGLGGEQPDQLLNAARLADGDLVGAVRVAREPAESVSRARGGVRGSAMGEEADERRYALLVADLVLVLGVVVCQVAQRSRRVRRRLHPIVRWLLGMPHCWGVGGRLREQRNELGDAPGLADGVAI